MKCSRETLQNLPYFWNTKTYAVFSFCATLVFTGKNKVARNEKRKKLHGFSYSKRMVNFEAFHWNISSSINLYFLKSAKHHLTFWSQLVENCTI